MQLLIKAAFKSLFWKESDRRVTASMQCVHCK